ncbi:MAG: tetratricopeptide repeat protein [Thermoguttaceae bacterium]|nr:tetratricopeptide repeat protein [Thermoguttaceae bacterium]
MNVLVLLATWGTLAGGACAADLEEAYWRGKQELVFGRYATAVTFFTQAIASNGQNGGAYRCRAFASLLSGQPEAAIRDFSAAIRLEGKQAVLYYGRGSARALQGDAEQAIQDFSEAIRLDPDYLAAYRSRLRLYRDCGESRKHRDDLRRATELSRSDAFRGRPLRYRATEAADLIGGTYVDLWSFPAYACWVSLFREARELKQTPSGFETMLRIRLPTPESYREDAVLRAVQREFDKSLASLDKASRLNPSDWRTYRLRGVICIVKGDLPRAETAFSKAIELKPADSELYFQRGQVRILLGNLEKGEEDITESARLLETEGERVTRESRNGSGGTP